VDDADQIELTLPADPEFVRLARLTGAGLASRLGFDFDQIEDVRIAIDELCFLLVGTSGTAGRILLTYTVSPGELVIEGDGLDPAVELSAMSERILAVVTDSHEIRRDGQRVRFRLVRRRGA
jgi:serine/threonine-protein kinase RsbW